MLTPIGAWEHHTTETFCGPMETITWLHSTLQSEVTPADTCVMLPTSFTKGSGAIPSADVYKRFVARYCKLIAEWRVCHDPGSGIQKELSKSAGVSTRMESSRPRC